MRKALILTIALSIFVIPSLIRASHVTDHLAGKVTTCSEGLSWNGNTEADMEGYRVLVGRSSGVYGTPFSVLHAPVPRILVPCADAGVISEGQYYFAVVAVDKTGNESLISDEYPFFVDRPPATPGGLDVN